jgi:transcriptional regulator with XRE-family HTH domain
MVEFAKALEMRPQTLNNYLSGQARPGGILQDRLRQLGCDIAWLMYGETSTEINKQYADKVERDYKWLFPEKVEIIEYLQSLGIETKEQVVILFETKKLAENFQMMLNEKLAEYNSKKK